jgi:plastocyanin
MRAHPNFFGKQTRFSVLFFAIIGIILFEVPYSNPDFVHSSNANYPVSIANYAFQPLHINITTGTIVIWTNHDSVAHTVTSSSGPNQNQTVGGSPLINSGNMNPNQSFNYTFDLPGYYPYQCAYHFTTPSMNGWIVVTGNPVVPPTPGPSSNSGFPWPLVVGLMVAAVAVILVAWLFLKRRKVAAP